MRLKFKYRHCANGVWYPPNKWHDIDDIAPSDLERWIERGQVEVDSEKKPAEAAAVDGAPETATLDKPKKKTWPKKG